MTVSVVSLLAKGGEDIEVVFEISNGAHSQKEGFIVSSRTVADLKLRVGECDRELFDQVSREAELYRAVKRGINILVYGACSEKMLIRKLVAKGTDPEIALCAVRELVTRGYMDPHADAVREAEKCVNKLWGRRRITAELFKKGYSEHSVKQALYALEDNEVDFAEICAERLKRTVAELPDDPMERRKLVASLERYGFSGSEIKDAFRIIASEL